MEYIKKYKHLKMSSSRTRTKRLATRDYPCFILDCYSVTTNLRGEYEYPEMPEFEWEVPHGSFVIGRTSENANIVIEDISISRQHAKIDVMPNSVVLTDLGSSNGIWVDGNRLGSIKIMINGTKMPEIFLGNILLEVRQPVLIPKSKPKSPHRFPFRLTHGKTNISPTETTEHIPQKQQPPQAAPIPKAGPIHWQDYQQTPKI